MRKVRVFIPAPLAPGAHLKLPAFSAEHLTRVLRLPDGAEILCFNGDGTDYTAHLAVHGKGAASIRVGPGTPVAVESALAITLAQAVVRGEKMDLILQKATELGVVRFVPVISERTEVKLDEDRAERRLAHWQRVVESACEQSGRAVVPRVEAPITIAKFAEGARFEDLGKVLLHPRGAISPRALQVQGPLLLAVGPEGGFSERDLAVLEYAQFQRVRLGPRILRTETAGLAALAALQAHFGDLG